MKISPSSYKLSSRKRTRKKVTPPKKKEGQNSSCLVMGNLVIGLRLGFPKI